VTQPFTKIDIKALLSQFKSGQTKRFAFVLGAGASKESGIPVGGEMVLHWLYEYGVMKGVDLDEITPSERIEWAEENVPGWNSESPGANYSLVYDLAFKANAPAGFDYLQRAMTGKQPSYGYFVLARLLANQTRNHKLVITTNFDQLVETACLVYESRMPLVCGHRSLAGHIDSDEITVPTVVKVHHDLLLGPHSGSADTAELPDEFRDLLDGLLSRHRPLFIGYAGNDPSLMDYLSDLAPGTFRRGAPIWCYLKGDLPTKRTIDFVTKHHGWLVEIPGFDSLLLQIGEVIGETLPSEDDFHRQGRERFGLLKRQFDTLRASTDKNTSAAAVATAKRTGGEWAWQADIAKAKSATARQKLYEEAIADLPNSAPLLDGFAKFLTEQGADDDRAESLYKRAVEADPTNETYSAAFALFLLSVRKDPARAEAVCAPLVRDLRFVEIPAGTFVMGSPPDEQGRHDNETQHPVTISKPFRMMAYPVTQRLWQAVTGNNPSTFQGPDLPVTDVSWGDAQAFLTKLNGLLKPNAPYRLPTEAEWEYACRAGTTGARYGELDRIAWHGDNSGRRPHPVGEKQPNGWGLYDTLGNVWEWCHDWYGEYPEQGVVDPQRPMKGRARVLRGGSWSRGPANARASSRAGFNPGTRYVYYGFRCAQ
jgi:formylglycine-generating enzyme required for sulfatase activity